MKFYTSTLIASALVQHASAFPAMDSETMARAASNMKRQAQGPNISGNNVADPAQVGGVFDPAVQYVSNKGQYKWVAPGPTDARGPCPGLNAMANHGYIPHNGVATIPQFITGTQKVFGMALDLGGFLAVYGALLNGDGTKWSIGGRHPTVPGANGITGSHNNYEADVSPTRPDLYQYGNNYEVRWEQWKEFLSYQQGIPNEQSNFNLKVLQEFRSKRWDQSVSGNPYFFNAPFAGVAVQPAAFTFIYRFMGNKSREHPEGQLTRSVLSDFFGVTDNGDGTYSGGAGFERIPDNWYKRHPTAEYSIPFFILDLKQEAQAYPKFLSVGGNTGKVNTFTGIAPEMLTSGIFNAKTLLEGNNLFCYAYQYAAQIRADLLTTLLSSAKEAGRAILALGCPQLVRYEVDNLNRYPGYTRQT